MPEREPDARALDVPPEHVVRSSLGRGWHGLDAAEILHPEDDFAVPALPHHVLVFNLGCPTAATERASGRTGQLRPEGVMILPGSFSPYHLARPFKAATGVPPHRYVIRRWVERARLLLATTDRPLDAIAQAVGFAGAGHLGRLFRRHLGVTPAAYHWDLKGCSG